MLVQCWKIAIDDDTTFNQHWVSASQKKAVTSAERKYILDLQVSKYGLLYLWQEETKSTEYQPGWKHKITLSESVSKRPNLCRNDSCNFWTKTRFCIEIACVEVTDTLDK